MHILLYLALSLAFLMPQHLYARDNNLALNVDAGYDHVVMPELFSTSVLIDDDENPPIEPNIVEVKFLKLPGINGDTERVDRLIQGIKKDMPPEYDHYGHEIRRYMAGVGNIKIFKDEEYLIQQIKNVRKAEVIADFWGKHLNNEISELEKIINDNKNTTFSVRTAFKQNKVTAKTFLISLKGWIDKNKIFLMGVLNNDPEIYEILYPEIIIKSSQDRLDLYNNLTARQIKLKEIKAYQPFAMMVY